MKDLGWGIGTTIYVSWWQKTDPDIPNISRRGHVGIYGGGDDPWEGSNNSSTGNLPFGRWSSNEGPLLNAFLILWAYV